LLGVARVREQREEEKKSAQHILALGDPCDRFDVRGMPREQRRDRRAPPRPARHTQQREKQQHGIRRVQQDVNEMLRAGTRAEQLPVEHVREPRERMPVRGVAAAERPRDAGRHDAAGQMRVVNHVLVVVVINVSVPRRGHVEQQRQDRKRDAKMTRGQRGARRFVPNAGTLSFSTTPNSAG